MDKRIKELRKALNMTQNDFGKRIGLTPNTVTNYETGRRVPSNQVIFSICREFNVHEEWLRDGTGEMFNTMSQDEELAYIVGQALPNASKEMKETFIAFGKLSQQFTADDWAVIRKFLRAIAGEDE